MKIYISGPITGRPDGNRKVFLGAEAMIEAKGHKAINPHKVLHDHGRSWLEYMRQDIKALMEADAVLMLPGWSDSRGAMVEYQLASGLGLLVIDRLMGIPEGRNGAEVVR